MVWDGDYPWDVRVEKVCTTLIASGHEVHLVCRNSKALPRTEIIDGIHIHRVFCFNGPLRRLNSAITFPAFFSPIWLTEIHRALKTVRPDVVIIRDLPIALAVVGFTRAMRIPAVLDMAECYPEMIRCAWQFDKFRFSNILVRNPFLADFVEKITLRNLDMVWVMIGESGDRLRRKGVPDKKIRIVSNTPPLAVSDDYLPRAPGPTLRIVYVGLVNPSRGLATLVEAAKILKGRGVDFAIKIVGSGKDSGRIQELIETCDVGDHVQMTGWIDHKSLSSIFAEADAGIVPHYSCSHWNNTIPNKIFDYMKMGIPVIVSDAKPTERIIGETRAGLSYRSFDAADLADKISALQSEALRKELGHNGYTAVRKKYHWAADSLTMLDSLDALTAEKSPSIA
jgi:glycosyltransferase involved in cell wall biosynthesis